MTYRIAVMRGVMLILLALGWGFIGPAQIAGASSVPQVQVEPETQEPLRSSPFYDDLDVSTRSTPVRRQAAINLSAEESQPGTRAKTPLPTSADFEEESGETIPRSRISLGPSLFWVVGILTIGWIARQCLKAGGPFPGRGISSLEILSRHVIGPQQQLALIRLGSRVLLVGTTPSGMSTLATIDHPAEVEELLKELQSGKSAPRPTWKDLFTPAVDAEFRRQPVDSVNVSTLRPGSRAPVDADPVRPARPQTVEVTDV